MLEQGRKRAKEIQGQLPELASKAADRHGDKQKRLSAILDLGAAQDDRAFAPLLSNLSDDDGEFADVSAHSIASLIRFSDANGKGRAKAVQEFRAMTKNENFWGRHRYKMLQALARGLYNAGDDDTAVPMLTRLYETTKDMKHLSFLLERTDTGDLAIRAPYRSLYAKIMNSDRPADDRLKAARVLAKSGDDAGAKQLLNLLSTSTDREVRVECLRSLWELKNEDGRKAAAAIDKKDNVYRFAQDLLKNWK